MAGGEEAERALRGLHALAGLEHHRVEARALQQRRHVPFENELFAFPNGRYDDQVDAVIHALDHKPAPLWIWNAAALKGLENVANSLWLQNMRGF